METLAYAVSVCMDCCETNWRYVAFVGGGGESDGALGVQPGHYTAST